MLEIPKDCFMIFLKEGLTIVYKIEIKNAHFFPQGRNNLNVEELEILQEYMEKHKKLQNLWPEVTEPTAIRDKFGPIVKDIDLEDEIVPPIGTYDCDYCEASSNVKGC
ncbi:hypothetical protein SUGI_1147380 [Cryptomeria japonica]|nr:hypothetical protein SUGI_1147380 [Cryptomeria japonica]